MPVRTYEEAFEARQQAGSQATPQVLPQRRTVSQVATQARTQVAPSVQDRSYATRFTRGAASGVGQLAVGAGGFLGRLALPKSLEERAGVSKPQIRQFQQDIERTMIGDPRQLSAFSPEKIGQFAGESLAFGGGLGGIARRAGAFGLARLGQKAPQVAKAIQTAGTKVAETLPKSKPGRFAAGAGVTAAEQEVFYGDVDPITTIAGGVLRRPKQPVEEVQAKNFKTAKEFITKIIQPSRAAKGQLKFDADPAGEILRQNIQGETLEELGNNTVKRLETIGKELGAIYKNDKNNYSIASVRKVLKAIKKEFLEQGNKKQAEGLNDVLEGIFYQISGKKIPKDTEAAATFIADMINKKISANKLWEIIKRQNSAINYTQEAVEKGKNKARYKIVKELQRQLAKNNPTLKSKNKAYQNLTEANVAIKNRDNIKQKNNFIGLPETIVGVGAATAMGNISGAKSALLALGVGMTATAIGNAAKSPATRRQMASLFYNLSKEQQAKFFTGVKPSVKAAFLRAIKGLDNYSE